MRLTLGIDLDNAAFEDNPDELLEHLTRVAQRATASGFAVMTGIIQDSNGNTVGSWSIQQP